MLVIVESPAKAKTISKIVGSKYTVKASVGHIRRISDDKKNKDGKKLEINGIDIENNFTPIFEVDEKKKKVVAELKKLAKENKEILFATDSDREGEAISWHLSEILGIKDKTKVKRLEFHEITKKAIEEAIKSPVTLNSDLVEAQKARQVLDKLVGYKLSPTIWKVMNNYRLSAGRVQSPALRLVCEREEEIKNFVPEEFWDVEGSFSSEENKTKEVFIYEKDKELKKEKEENKDLFKLAKIAGKKLEKLSSEENLKKLIEGLVNRNKFTVKSISFREEKTRTKPPFITSTLQQTASSKLGYTPKITMGLAQKLYEGVDIDGEPTALITYMRTDSVNLSEESLQKARKHIQENYKNQLPSKPKIYSSKSKNAQEAHEAIRPTNPLLTPEKLKGKLEPKLHKLYSLIWSQMIASQMTDEIKERASFELENQNLDMFTGSVAWTKDPGFKLVTGDKIYSKPDIKLNQGDVVFLQEIFYTQNFTKPPNRYSPASLIKKLEELGIGRPSTYASIISTLVDRSYVDLEKNSISPTTLGSKVNNILVDNFELVTSSKMTAEMEDNLDDISNGKKDYKKVLDDFWWGFKKKVEEKTEEVLKDKQKYKNTQTDVKCPKCGSDMELKIGRFGEYFQCLAVHEHQFPKNFREYEEALKKAEEEYNHLLKNQKCEECGKDLIVRVSRSSLKPYIACPDYRVGNKHTVLSIKKLQEK